jgi:SAM-dependent methyltransferase
MHHDIWSTGIHYEIEYWKAWLSTCGGEWPGDYRFRTDPNSRLQDTITDHLFDFSGDTLKIIDVGAGPMTILGKNWQRAKVEITAVDALADLYDSLPFPENMPLIKALKCDSERLTELFSQNSFDVAYARNTLDHGYDPALAIQQMLQITKPGGSIILDHFANEAIKEKWAGFHQWNFSIENGDVIISGRVSRVALSSLIDGRGRFSDISPDRSEAVFCVIKKDHT